MSDRRGHGQGAPVRRRRHPAATVLPVTAALLLVLLGCSPEGPPPPAEPGPEIPHPPLDEMDAAVAQAIEGQRLDLEDLLRRGDASAAEQARALGRLGQLYQAHRLVEAAEACYREAHGVDPERFEWAYYLGVLAGRLGKLEQSAAAFRDALELRAGDLPTLVRLADMELDRGRTDAAHMLYDQASSLDPSMAAAEYGLGRVAAERRNYLEAVEHFDRALALQPRASVIHYHLGQAYRQLGRLDLATSHLSQSGPVNVAMADPLMSEVNSLVASSSPYLMQGNTALRDGRLSVAAKAFRQATEADPDNPKARQSLATVLSLLRDRDGALEQLQAAARLAPDNAEAQSALGSALAEQGRDEPALEHLRRAVELEPDLQKAQFNLANTLARMGRLQEAETHYRRLLEIDPNHLLARSRLSTVLAQTGQLDQALSEMRWLVAQDPDDAQEHLNLGIALAQAGRMQEAIAEHRRVLELPADEAHLARAHFNLGTFQLETRDPDLALEHFRRALGYDDRLMPAHLNVANLLAGSGRLAEALPHFARVRELEPGHRTARIGEGIALMYLGRYSDSKRILEEAVRIAPKESSAAHALARLLAGAPEPALRDGERSLALVSRLLESTTPPSYVETLAMALAQVGRFEEAASRQRAVLEEAKSRGHTADQKRLARNLARYEGGDRCCADPKDVFP